MAIKLTTLTQQRGFLLSALVVAIVFEELLHAILALALLGTNLTLVSALTFVAKYSFAMMAADVVYGRLALSALVVYYLPDITLPHRAGYFCSYLGAAIVSGVISYALSSRYAVMFIGESFWLKPICFQLIAWMAGGLVWSSYCVHSLNRAAVGGGATSP